MATHGSSRNTATAGRPNGASAPDTVARSWPTPTCIVPATSETAAPPRLPATDASSTVTRLGALCVTTGVEPVPGTAATNRVANPPKATIAASTTTHRQTNDRPDRSDRHEPDLTGITPPTLGFGPRRSPAPGVSASTRFAVSPIIPTALSVSRGWVGR